jgi:hypothetical protein
MVGLFGMGSTLRVVPEQFLDTKDAALFQRYSFLQNDVDAILLSGFEDARETLTRHRDVVLSLAEALTQKPNIFGDELESLLLPLPSRSSRAVFTRGRDFTNLPVAR